MNNKKQNGSGYWKGRVHILLNEEGWGSHGVVIAPVDMDWKSAQVIITKAFTEAKAASVEWSYRDMINALEKQGFDFFYPYVWDEPQ